MFNKILILALLLPNACYAGYFAKEIKGIKFLHGMSYLSGFTCLGIGGLSRFLINSTSYAEDKEKPFMDFQEKNFSNSFLKAGSCFIGIAVAVSGYKRVCKYLKLNRLKNRTNEQVLADTRCWYNDILNRNKKVSKILQLPDLNKAQKQEELIAFALETVIAYPVLYQMKQLSYIIDKAPKHKNALQARITKFTNAKIAQESESLITDINKLVENVSQAISLLASSDRFEQEQKRYILAHRPK